MIGWLISRLGPMLIPVAVSGGVFFGAGWFAHGVKFDWHDRPAIIREATATADAACAIRTMDAANRAEQAERARQSRASAEAMRIYREAIDAGERAAVAEQAHLEQENADYAAQLKAAGRECDWTELDLDDRARWLHQYGATGAD